ELDRGAVLTPSFLIDMDKVFEDFVFRAIGERLSIPGTRWRQGKTTTLDEAGRIRIKPDLSLWRGGSCCFVGDAKYKATDVGDNDDLYQLLAYVRATGLESGLLVYATTARQASTHVVRYDGARLHVRQLDLTASEPALLKDVADLSRYIAGTSTAASAVAS
nr:restriction endonuclease [Chloroflexota bacterium]